MELSRKLAQLNAKELRNLTATLIAQLSDREQKLAEREAQIIERDAELSARTAQLARRNEELKHKQLKIDQLTHEMATLKRWRYGRHSEQLDVVQRSLLDESIDEDIEAISLEIEALKEQPAAAPKLKPRRVALPASLPRREIRHDPEHTQCRCGCGLERIGEDVSEKLDYTPGVFEVERHIRGKWVCRRCEELIQAPVPPHIIDKGIPTAGLLAQVLIAKYLDHAPLYRQESIFERAGLALPRSTLAQWVGACGVKLQPLVDAMKVLLLTRTVLHADETPVPMLKPGLGRTHRAYLWSYSTTEYDELQAVIYDFADSRGGVHAREFLGGWRGKLVCDDYAGYKALFDRGVIEIGCMAHARRKFHDLYANHRSDLAEEALRHFAELYEIEREARELKLDADARRQLRQQRSKPIAETLRQWLVRQRRQVPDGSATAKAIDYSLRRWAELIRYIEDGDLPIGRVDDWRGKYALQGVAVGRRRRCLSLRRISRFQSPLVEPDKQISRIRLSCKSLRPSLSPRRTDFGAVDRGRASRKDTRRGTCGTRCPSALAVGSAIAADAGRCKFG
jgi:transposase